jgi:hypothetical protein
MANDKWLRASGGKDSLFTASKPSARETSTGQNSVLGCEQIARQSHLELWAVARSAAAQLFSLPRIGTAPRNLPPGTVGADEGL